LNIDILIDGQIRKKVASGCNAGDWAWVYHS